MAINNQMPERYRSMFIPVQNLFQRIKQIEQFQTNQNNLNLYRMCQHNQRVQEIVDGIEGYEATEQSRILQQCKSMHHLIQRRTRQR